MWSMLPYVKLESKQAGIYLARRKTGSTGIVKKEKQKWDKYFVSVVVESRFTAPEINDSHQLVNEPK